MQMSTEPNMSIRDVEDAIQKIREVVEEWKVEGETEWMEVHTKYAVVDPIIRALGWDTADPKMCHPEFPRPFPTGRVDYALFAASAVADIVNDGVLPDAIIESKYLGAPLDESVSQLQRYAESEPPMESGVAVLTDGGKWWIYDLSLRSSFTSKLAERVDILTGSRRASAQILNQWLSRARFG